MSKAQFHTRVMLLLCYDAALRGGTAVQCAPKHIRNGRVRMHTKFGDSVDVPLSPRLAAHLAIATFGLPPEVAQSVSTPYSALLFGRPYRLQQFENDFARLREATGIQTLTLHDLRRSKARELYATTHDLRAVQSLLGHRSLRSTLHYLDAGVQPVEAL